MDTPACVLDFRKLVDRFDIPSAFVSERLRSVTHSFGARRLEDGSETVWIHFLGVLPSQLTSQWVKSGLALKWSPAVVPDNVQTVSISKPFQQVTLIYFNPAPEFWRAINRVFKSNSWEDSLEDPYLLINMAFESWYELIDTSAWEVNDLSREAEKETFKHSAELEDDSSNQSLINYNRIHTLAKDAIFLLEGLDAVLRSIECAIRCHTDMEKFNPVIWKATHEALHYRREMFHSTRLRTISVEQRLRNVINLAFNIGSMRDSRVMWQDSYIMRTLSVLAMIFLPISTVGSIFGTQFFSSIITPDPSSDNGGVTSSFYVNSRFWLLWVIAIPMTLGLLVGWRVWIRRSRRKVKRANKRIVDVETADIGVTHRETSGHHHPCHPRERSHGGSISPR